MTTHNTPARLLPAQHQLVREQQLELARVVGDEHGHAAVLRAHLQVQRGQQRGQVVGGAQRRAVLVHAAQPVGAVRVLLAPGEGRRQHQHAAGRQSVARLLQHALRLGHAVQQVGAQHRVVRARHGRGQRAGVALHKADARRVHAVVQHRRHAVRDVALHLELVLHPPVVLELARHLNHARRQVHARHRGEARARQLKRAATHRAAQVQRARARPPGALTPRRCVLCAPPVELQRRLQHAALARKRRKHAVHLAVVQRQHLRQQRVALVQHLRRPVLGGCAGRLLRQRGRESAAALGAAAGAVTHVGRRAVHARRVHKGHHGVVRAVAGHVVRRQVGVRRHHAEGGVLEEVRAELVARKLGGQLAGGDEGAAQDELVLARKAGRREVLVVGVHLEAGQCGVVVLAPLPRVAHGVVEAGVRRGQLGHGRLRAVRQLQVVAALAGRVRAAEAHGQVGVALRVLRGGALAGRGALRLQQRGVVHAVLAGAQQVVLRLADHAVLDGRAVLLRLPRAVGLGLVVVDVHGPVPAHVHRAEQRAQRVLVQALRPVGDPERGPLDVAERAPAPALLRPVLALRVAAALDEAQELAVGDLELGRGERGHVNLLTPVLVVPAKRGVRQVLAQHHARGRHAHQRVGGEVGALRGQCGRRLAGGRVVVGPVLGLAHAVQRQLADEHRRRLDVDALVLKAHEHRPAGVVPPHLLLVQARVGLDDVAHHLVRLAAVLGHDGHGRPVLARAGQVVPRHLVHARLKQLLKEGVDAVLKHARHAQLVDVHHGGVAVVEDHGVAQLVVWLADESILALQGGQEHLSQGPAVVKVVQNLLAGKLAMVGQRQ
mmetsp:Transcript_9835/g.24526  ORF Transcript_9835/g.24526 Transcript_9835/m.24526 type:complete len:832 (+) Transcript_9835:440-2935(+)